MTQRPSVLSRGARMAGSVCLSLLALLSVGWIIRDFVATGEIPALRSFWSGDRWSRGDILATNWMDPFLAVLYVVGAVKVVRSSFASGMLLATGLTTVVLRLPSLWKLTRDLPRAPEGGLLLAGALSALAMLLLGLALSIIAAAGRHPASGGQFPGRPHGLDPTAHPPARPTTAAGVVAGVLLLVTAGTKAAWEIYTWTILGWEHYQLSLTGAVRLYYFLAPPAGWATWTLVLLTLAAAVSALARATFTRPLGLVTTALLLSAAGLNLVYWLEEGTFSELGEWGVVGYLSAATVVCLPLITLATLILLAAGKQRSAPSVGGWPPPPGTPQPGYAPPYGAAPYGGPGQAPPPPAAPPGG